VSDLSFASPVRLLALLAVAALVIAYVLVQRRRSAYAVRFADLDLLASVAPKTPGWRRHLPAALLVAALTLMTAAFARPTASVSVPRDAATIVVAIDVSPSMQATDVTPNRITAAEQAAAAFVQGLPPNFAVALVDFSATVNIAVPATKDHPAVVAAIRQLQMGEGTAIGEAVAASVAAANQSTPTPGQQAAPARIVLLSDGGNTQGRSLASAEPLATQARIPVSTIAYGTAEGTVTVQGTTVRVPVDAPALQQLATATGGQAYTAQSSSELHKVYSDIAKQVGTTSQRREVSAGFAGLALLAALAAAGASLAWSPRMP
jgi:Ca-activated chloride channel family protein